MLERTKMKHWKQFKKEVVAAAWEAIVYYFWKRRETGLFSSIGDSFVTSYEGYCRTTRSIKVQQESSQLLEFDQQVTL